MTEASQGDEMSASGRTPTTLAVPPQSRMIGFVLGLGVVAVSLLLWLLIALAAFGLYKVLT